MTPCDDRTCAGGRAVSGWKHDGTAIRLGIGILVAGQSMIFGLALNLHDDVPAEIRGFAQTVILAATLVVVALLGGPLVRTAWHELSRGRLTIEALFLLTLSGAMAASLQAHVTGRGKIYFEVVSVLLVVYTLGKVIGARSRAAALDRSRAWGEELGTCRLVDVEGHTRRVPVTEAQPGDVIEVNPGEAVAVDGVIREGTGFMSEGPVSGEPFAVVCRPGDRVLAGTASYDATFRIEATAPGTGRQVDRLLAAVEAARERPLSLQARADAVGRVFFPLVVFTALGTFAYWTFFTAAGWEAALFNAMSVLLVACPCAIGLATPVVIWSAIGRLAERGLIVRAGDAVERLAEADRVMLDKTGTLTDDSFAILDIATAATGDERAELLGWLSVIEERCSHPVARPFARLPRPFSPETQPRVLSVKVIPGRGVEAVIEASGVRHTVQIGTPGWIATLSRDAQRSMLGDQLRAAGHRIDVALDGRLVAVAVLAERLRDSTPQALAGFRRLGLPVEVLTGDAAERAAALNLRQARGELHPDDKRAAVEAAKAAGGKPLFVGDGINDAAALAAAHPGIALAGGTEIAVAAADVTLCHDDLRVIPWAVELSRDAVRAVRRNLYRAAGYNLIGMALAACGVLHPVVAAVLMVVSSLNLIVSSTRVDARVGHCTQISEDGGQKTEDRLPATASSVLRPPSSVLSPRRALWHGLAFGLQGVAGLLLLAGLREPPIAGIVLGGFALAGVALAWLWWRWASIPHALDMCVGMLTLGNLGMLLGWWTDNGFAPLQDGCCGCVHAVRECAVRPWMWVGMLLGANAAMLGLARHSPARGSYHTLAMYTGGNLGMVIGMLAGGWCAGQCETTSVVGAAVAGFAGMTAGMLAGMLVGTWLTENLCHPLWDVRVLARRRRRELTRTSG